MTEGYGAHETLEREEEIKGSSDRGFAIVFAVVFLIVALFPLLGDGGVRLWSLIVAAAFLVVGYTVPTLLAPLNRLWMRVGLLLHKVMNPILLGLIFGLAVVPTGLAMRLFGKDPLNRKLDPNAESYWIVRDPPGPDPQTMKNQF